MGNPVKEVSGQLVPSAKIGLYAGLSVVLLGPLGNMIGNSLPVINTIPTVPGVFFATMLGFLVLVAAGSALKLEKHVKI